jgi:hypothetical protein
MEQISKIFKENVEIEVKTKNIEKILDESEFEMDLKFFVFVNGIFDKNIYKNIRGMAPFIKKVF